MRRQQMSPTEREEYDALMTEAGFDGLGKPYPAAEVAGRMHDALLDAVQAGRRWAEWVIEDDTHSGHLSRWKRWSRQRLTVSTPVGDRMVERSAVMSMQRRDPESGQPYWQDTFYPDMTRDDLVALAATCQGRMESERITLSTARALIALLDETDAGTVADALASKGATLDGWLAEYAGRAKGA